MVHHNRPFYDKHILADREQEYIENLLKKYRQEPVTEELKKKIWDELQLEKNAGRVSIPFKVVIRKDIYGKYPDMIDIILDTKV